MADDVAVNKVVLVAVTFAVLSGLALPGCRGAAGTPAPPGAEGAPEPPGMGDAGAGGRGHPDDQPPGTGLGASPSAVLSPTLGVTLTDFAVWGALTPDEARDGVVVAVEVARPGGAAASGQASTVPGDRAWRVYLSDASGADVSVMPGDTVRAAVGDRVVEAVVPDIRLALGPGALDGRTAITVTARHPATGLRAAWVRAVPWARVSLHPGDVTGALRPRAGMTLTLYGADDEARGAGAAVTDRSGRFSVWARDPAGRRVRPEAGDRVVIDDGESRLTVDVPPLAGDWDLGAGILSGPAQPGARIEAVLWNPWRPGEVATPATAAGADGTWSLAGIPLHPATHFYLTELLAPGDQAYYCQQVPMVYVEPGSSAVEVQTLWEVEAALELMRGGRVVARARGGGPWSRNLVLALRDDAGRPAAVQPGDRLTGTVDRAAVDIAVGRFDARLDPATGRIAGHAAPGARVGLARDRQVIQAAETTAAADGAFTLDAGGALVDGWPGPGVEIQAFQPLGDHNLRARFVGPSLTATLGGRAAGGRATPGARITVVRAAADADGGAGGLATAVSGAAAGDARAAVSAVADAAGRWEVDWPASTPPLAAGERLALQVEDGTWRAYTLPDLTAEIDAAAGAIVGGGTPGGVVSIEAFVGADIEPVTLSGFIGDDGRWAVDLRDRGDGTGSIDARQLRRVIVSGLGDDGSVRRVVER